jgi:hypothetical protein
MTEYIVLKTVLQLRTEPNDFLHNFNVSATWYSIHANPMLLPAELITLFSDFLIFFGPQKLISE